MSVSLQKLDNIPILILDNTGKIIYTSPTLHNRTGITCGKGAEYFQSYLNPSDRKTFNSLLQAENPNLKTRYPLNVDKPNQFNNNAQEYTISLKFNWYNGRLLQYVFGPLEEKGKQNREMNIE